MAYWSHGLLTPELVLGVSMRLSHAPSMRENLYRSVLEDVGPNSPQIAQSGSSVLF
jgi:hypothetical protein